MDLARSSRGKCWTTKRVAQRLLTSLSWDQGLLDMCIGDKRTLTIPPELGYGQRAIGPIPAGSTLIFETELVGIDGVEAPEKIEPIVENTEETAGGVAEKVADAVADAADAAKTALADTDDIEGHEEL